MYVSVSHVTHAQLISESCSTFVTYTCVFSNMWIHIRVSIVYCLFGVRVCACVCVCVCVSVCERVFVSVSVSVFVFVFVSVSVSVFVFVSVSVCAWVSHAGFVGEGFVL